MTEPTGYTALDLIGFTDQGEYDSTTAYVQNDLVHYDNTIWRCLIDDTTGQTPAEGDYWTVFVESESAASGVTYDNTSSGLTAEDVQDAIDEVVEEKADSTLISDAYDSTATYAVGDYFIYDNVLYYVDVACTGITPPNTSYYTATSVSSEISNRTATVSGTLSSSDTDTLIASYPDGFSIDNSIILCCFLITSSTNKGNMASMDLHAQLRDDGIYTYCTKTAWYGYDVEITLQRLY